MPQKKTIEDIQKGRTNLYMLRWKDCEPATIDINGNPAKLNVREEENFGTPREQKEFALSLIGGIKETVYGYMGENGKFQITNGERRWRGARWLDQEKGIQVLLPCLREPKHKQDGTGGYTDRDRNLDLLRTNSGRSLQMAEKAVAMRRLLEAGMDEKEIARQAGCSQTHVSDCLVLLQADPSVLKAVHTGEIAASLAVDLVREIPDQEKQRATLEAGRQAAASAPAPRRKSSSSESSGEKKKKKVTSKHLPVATGKRKQAEKKADKQKAAATATPPAAPPPTPAPSTPAPPPAPEAPAPAENLAELLEGLLDTVQRGDCRDPQRYDTLEFLCEFAAGRKPSSTATKFVLGII